MKLSACHSTGTEINSSRHENSNERSDVGRKQDARKGDEALNFYFYLLDWTENDL